MNTDVLPALAQNATTLSPMAALIGATALLIVALVTAGVQIYIARRNWNEQRRQYDAQREDQRERDREEREDQRRRDADDREEQRRRDTEQRNDQRRRDRESQEREDRHRFVVDKRSVYAALLGAFEKYEDELGPLSATVLVDNGKAELGFFSDHLERIRSYQVSVELLAPKAINDAIDAARQKMFGPFSALRSASEKESHEEDYNLFDKKFQEYKDAIAELRSRMRSDLGTHGSDD